LALAVAAVLGGCGTSGETPVSSSAEPDPSAAVAEPPVAAGGAAAAAASDDPAADEAAEPSFSACLGSSQTDAWQATLALLARLEEMLPGFTPGTPPASCMTGVWAATDPAAASLEVALHADFQNNEEVRRRDWLNLLPQNAVWLRVYVPGVSRAWVRGAWVTYDGGAPALHRAVEAAEAAGVMDPSPSAPQHCVVLGAEIEGNQTTLFCGAPETPAEEAAFLVSMPDPAVRGRLGALAVGDVVRFGGYLSLVGDIPRGESEVRLWHFTEVETSTVEVVARGTCCPR
jgi:hypothetical protein